MIILNWDSYTLLELGDLRRNIEVIIYDRVQEQRKLGVTWAAIAADLRVSTQEAHRRYRVSQYPLTDPQETATD